MSQALTAVLGARLRREEGACGSERSPGDSFPVWRSFRVLVGGLSLVVLAASAPRADEMSPLAKALDSSDPRVLTRRGEERARWSRLLADDVDARLREADRRQSAAWRRVKGRDEWLAFLRPRLAALRRSLGDIPSSPAALESRVTRTLSGDGFEVDNVVFASRAGLLVTANVYRPAAGSRPGPGILICHSHHHPKEQGELQDMGMTWARLGATVLVMDQLGHGERRQHPFRGRDDYRGSFRPSRQDYYFRYNVGIQLHLLGESLVGWMVRDLARGVDFLLSRPGVDPRRIVLIGAVAGGGDPAAVAAALDPRIAVVVPFNFGGPQPETRYPLREDAEESFRYAGSGSWESTRNLRLSARDGFLPWVVVAAAAPRHLIYAHEFAWDRERDPVWRRLKAVFSFLAVPDHLASLHGGGAVTGRGAGHTHCNNVGPVHRRQIYPHLERWLALPSPAAEYRGRRSREDLRCLPPELVAELGGRPVQRIAAEIASRRALRARLERAALPEEERRAHLATAWRTLLGDVEPAASRVISRTSRAVEALPGLRLERVVLGVERDIVVPLVLWLPGTPRGQKLPVVVGIAQAGKGRLLGARAEFVAELLRGGVAVCLADVRGTGETAPGDGRRGRRSAATAISSSELMLGGTLVGARLRDLRTVLGYLRSRDAIDGDRLALWGDSLAPVNRGEPTDLAAPLDADPSPGVSEPLGGLLALLGALFDERIACVLARGGLASFRSLLESPFLHVPHDVVVPGALRTGDLVDIASALAPRPLRLAGVVDGLNRPLPAAALAEEYRSARRTYDEAGAGKRLVLDGDSPQASEEAGWVLRQLAAAQ